MADALRGAAYIAFAAACMSRGLTPTESDNLWYRLAPQVLPDSVATTQIWLEEGINQIRTERLAGTRTHT